MPKKKSSLLKKKILKVKRESSTKELWDRHTSTSSEGGTSKEEVSLLQSSVPCSSVESGRDSWASEEIRRKRDGMGLTYPQSSQEKKRKRARKRRIKRIIRTIKDAPPIFKGVDVEGEDPNAKKVGANSQPSPAMKKLERRMRERKFKMRALTAKNPLIRQLLLAYTGPEVRRYPTLLQSTIGSKEEEVARELIGKTAKRQFRKRQGVWASWGKSYKCHGVPNVNPLQQTPMPEAPYSLDGPNKLASFKFFADHSDSSARQDEKRPKAAAKRKSASQIKREKDLKLAQRSSEMDEMLLKIGLLFPYDLDHAKFPKDHLQVSNDITKLIKYAGVYFQELREGMKRSIPRSLSVAPLEGDQFILGEGGQALPLYKEPGVELLKPASKTTATSSSMGTSSRLSKRSSLEQSPSSMKSCVKSQKKRPKGPKRISSTDNMVVFRWKKTNLTLRLNHEKDLRQKLSARMDRRERIRASSLFSSEVAKKLLKVMAEFLGRNGPDTACIWKIAEAHYEARQPQLDPFWKSAVFSVNRFYLRVATFIMEQPVADPLVDVLIYFLREWLEGGGRLGKAMLINLCSNLARIPGKTPMGTKSSTQNLGESRKLARQIKSTKVPETSRSKICSLELHDSTEVVYCT